MVRNNGSQTRSKWKERTYDEFNDINGREIRTKGGDPKIKASSKELFGLLLAFEWEIGVNTSATVHRYSPPAHISYSNYISNSLPPGIWGRMCLCGFSFLCENLLCRALRKVGHIYRRWRTSNLDSKCHI